MALLRTWLILLAAGAAGSEFQQGGLVRRFVGLGFAVGAILLLDFHVSCSIAEHNKAETKPEDPWEHHEEI